MRYHLTIYHGSERDEPRKQTYYEIEADDIDEAHAQADEIARQVHHLTNYGTFIVPMEPTYPTDTRTRSN